MNVVVFSGAGVSQESDISTFRDIKDGLWYNHKVDDVATLAGWKRNRGVVLEFHNSIRKALVGKEPNLAHTTIADWEKEHNVTVITQNVDALHEMAGSTNVLHLHGELNKSRSTLTDEIYDLVGEELNLGDKCPDDSQLRPHTVLFDEYPYNMEESVDVLREADVLVIVGTSLSIVYTIPLIYQSIANTCEVYYVDPEPSVEITQVIPRIKVIPKKATLGIMDIKFKND